MNAIRLVENCYTFKFMFKPRRKVFYTAFTSYAEMSLVLILRTPADLKYGYRFEEVDTRMSVFGCRLRLGCLAEVRYSFSQMLGRELLYQIVRRAIKVLTKSKSILINRLSYKGYALKKSFEKFFDLISNSLSLSHLYFTIFAMFCLPSFAVILSGKLGFFKISTWNFFCLISGYYNS